jgi:hypothetical protein
MQRFLVLVALEDDLRTLIQSRRLHHLFVDILAPRVYFRTSRQNRGTHDLFIAIVVPGPRDFFATGQGFGGQGLVTLPVLGLGMWLWFLSPQPFPGLY